MVDFKGFPWNDVELAASCQPAVSVQAAEDADAASIDNQIFNGTMEEASNGMLSYWEPLLGDGCTDNTVGRSNSNTVKIGNTSYTLSGRNGYYALVKPDGENYAYDLSNVQLLTGVPNGTYSLTAKVAANIGANAGSEAKLFAYADNKAAVAELPLASTKNEKDGKYAFTYVKIPNIQITNGKCKVGYSVKSNGKDEATAEFLAIDDMVLSAPVGVISGKVTGADQKAVENATVSLRLNGEIIVSVKTDKKGAYKIPNAPAGSGYTITAEYAGYQTAEIGQAAVTEGTELANQDLAFAAAEAIHANYVPGTRVSDMEENNKVYAVNLDGVEYYIVKDLELTSFGQHNEDNTMKSQGGRRGVNVRAKAGEGTVTHSITLSGLYIHDVNGHNAKKGGGSNGQEGAAIHFSNNGKGTYIDGLTIENCIMENITRNGVTSGGDDGGRPWWGGAWQQREPVRNQNVVIRGNVLDHISGDGLVPSGTYGALIEHNLVKYASCDARKIGTNTNLSAAVWPFDTDNSVFQYNEVCYTGTPKNTEVSDGEAFDSDYYSINTLFQYNYSHDNDGGFLMICGPAYAYNDGTVVRYNISENDGSMNGKRTIFEIGGGGGVDHSYIYNNTIYTGADHSVYSVVRGEPWDGKPKGTHFVNNIFCINSNTAKFGFAGDPRDKGKEGIVEYSSNLYCGTFFEDGGPEDMPEDKKAVFGDPKFVNPGNAGDGYENAAFYKIQEGSAAIGAGEVIVQGELGQRLNTILKTDVTVDGKHPTKAEHFFRTDDTLYGWQDPNGGRDFFGNAVPKNGPVDIGAHQFTTVVGAEGKTEALNGLKQYKDLQQYREAQQKEISGILAAAEAELAKAVSALDVKNVAASVKERLDAVKTAVQLLEEEAEQRRQQELADLKTENGNLKTENGNLKSENETVKTENGSLKSENETVKTENGTLKTEKGALKSENDTLKTEKQKLQEERDAVRKDLEKLQGVSSKELSDGDSITVGSVKYRVKDAEKRELEVYGVKDKKMTLLIVEDGIGFKDTEYKVVSVADKAFSNMKKLESAVIGKNVKTIGKKAFGGDRKLRLITVKGKRVAQVGKDAFKGIHKNAVIKVPKAKKSAYAGLLKGRGQKKSVKVKS